MTEGTMSTYSPGKTKHLRKVFHFLLVLIGFTSISCHQEAAEGSILIVQQTTEKGQLQTELALVDPDRPDKDPVVIVSEFTELASPEISYQGDAVLFQAKRNTEEPWQIWEYDLVSDELKQLTNADSDCKDPTYLPDGRIVYSRFVADYSGYHVLQTCQADGSAIQQITFAPIDFTSPIVLRDGRILALAKEVHPEVKRTQLMVMRPDGTKIELFYESSIDMAIVPAEGVFETADGRIAFQETTLDKDAGAEWVSVEYDDPMGSRAPLDTESESRMSPVVYETRPMPKKLPSAVDTEVETALLVCMDANLTAGEAIETQKKSAKVELLGLQGSLGTVDLEKDGSVYLKIQADMPFRMRTLDSEGKVVQGPSSWLQMRPNERRGCVGCHAGHTRVPDNRQPLAVQKEPVEIPLYRETIMASSLPKKDKK